MKSFEFITANRIVFGVGSVQNAAQYASEFGRRVFLVAGKSTPVDFLVDLLEKENLTVEIARTQGEPTVARLGELCSLARKNLPDLIIGIGGGSVIDSGKALAAILPNPGDVLDYLEVVGKNQPLVNNPLPYIAIPTTAGTGSEVTKNAVLKVPEKQAKVSLRSPKMLPQIALVDPELTLTVPPEVTASTGLDALAQVIEPYLSIKANPMVDLFCREGITRASRSLLRVYKNGNDLAARTDMAWCSLIGGLSLANAGLGAVHGFASPIGGMFEAPHGMICARLLPIVFSYNARFIRETDPSNPVLHRFLEVSCLLNDDLEAGISDGVRWLETIVEKLNVPGLSSYGIKREDIPAIVENAQIASSMKANPVKLPPEILEIILEEAL